MTINNSLEEFLIKNNIERQIWESVEIEWPVLQAIAEDHEQQSSQLEESATLFARLIQKYPHVHSVRWRVKDTNHLLEKIVRKLHEKNEKYQGISTDNYFNIVTDLVGIRVLHLFKEDCFQIGDYLTQQWNPIETPVAYIRTGDRSDLIELLKERNFDIKEHPAGYRSVHYVFSSQPMKRQVITEVQVRTIFEEGWSEIDHTVRYPNFSDNDLVEYFLTIFNRLAGSADEMGAFVRQLTINLRLLESRIVQATDEKSQILREMEKALGELEAAKAQDKNSQEHIEKLKAELARLKNSDLRKSSATLSIDEIDIPAFIRRNGLDSDSKKLASMGEKKLFSSSSIAKLLNDEAMRRNIINSGAAKAIGIINSNALETAELGVIPKSCLAFRDDESDNSKNCGSNKDSSK